MDDEREVMMHDCMMMMMMITMDDHRMIGVHQRSVFQPSGGVCGTLPESPSSATSRSPSSSRPRTATSACAGEMVRRNALDRHDGH